MYKKVLFNVKKNIKKCVGGGEGEGQYLNPKHSMYFLKPEDQWSCKRSPDILAK